MSKTQWRYGDTLFEEVNFFKYHGFTFQTNGYFTKHIKEMARNGNRRQCELWSLGERLTGFNDFEELERVQRKYLRWTLGLKKHTRVALLMDELKMYSVVDVTGKRAVQYGEKAAKSPCKILRE